MLLKSLQGLLIDEVSHKIYALPVIYSAATVYVDRL